jgi:hypothetical protein
VLVGATGIEPVTSDLSVNLCHVNSATGYFASIRDHEGEWRIMGNAQVDAAVEAASDSGSATIPPAFPLTLRAAVAARLLPCRPQVQSIDDRVDDPYISPSLEAGTLPGCAAFLAAPVTTYHAQPEPHQRPE